MSRDKRRPMNFHCHKVRVGDAGIKGRGVFARLNIKAKEAVEVAPTLVIPPRDVAAIGGTFLQHYSFGTHSNLDVIGLGYISLYNHSFVPNASFVITDRAILVIAARAIVEGEEIEFDYGWSRRDFEAQGIPVPAEFIDS